MCDLALDSGKPASRSLAGYELVRALQGGISGARVSHARDTKSGRQVVIKSLEPSRITSEILASCLTNKLPAQHRRLFPRVIDAGVADAGAPGMCPAGHAFIAMELVDGVPMDEYLARNPPPPRHATAIVFQVALALHAMRETHGLRHCDLHAGNVIVDADRPHTRNTGRFVLAGRKHRHVFNLAGCPRVKVIDFGLAEARNPAQRAGNFFAQYLLRMYQLYLNPNDIERVRLKIRTGQRISPELARFMRANTDLCRSQRSDIESVLGFEDLLLGLVGMDADTPAAARVPRPGTSTTYYRILTSRRFDTLRSRSPSSPNG
eukprot:jgi/Tetstr1/453944/TSEL_040863.t1